jgi:hypothetical protein
MNGREYNGSFASGLSFSAVCAILAVPSVLMVPISWYLVEEPKLVGTPNTGNKGTRFVPLTGNAKGDTKQAKAADAPTAPHPADDADETPWTLRSYCSTAGELLKSGLLFEVVCYSFFSAVIGGIGTTAGAEVQRVWADVENLPNQLFTMAGHFLFMLGLWIMRARYLGASWRVVIATTLVVTNLIDMPFTFCTIFNVVRNQVRPHAAAPHTRSRTSRHLTHLRHPRPVATATPAALVRRVASRPMRRTANGPRAKPTSGKRRPTCTVLFP